MGRSTFVTIVQFIQKKLSGTMVGHDWMDVIESDSRLWKVSGGSDDVFGIFEGGNFCCHCFNRKRSRPKKISEETRS